MNDLMDNNLRVIVKDKEQVIREEHASYFMYQIFCGVKAMHDVGIIHRDLVRWCPAIAWVDPKDPQTPVCMGGSRGRTLYIAPELHKRGLQEGTRGFQHFFREGDAIFRPCTVLQEPWQHV